MQYMYVTITGWPSVQPKILSWLTTTGRISAKFDLIVTCLYFTIIYRWKQASPGLCAALVKRRSEKVEKLKNSQKVTNIVKGF